MLSPLLAVVLAMVPAKLTPADVDRALAAPWAARHVAPAPPVDDVAFLRRAYLDLVGVIPSHSALLAFRSDTSPDRREKLVDLLLSTRRFADRWAEVLKNAMLGRQAKVPEPLAIAFESWLASRLSTKGVGLDRIAREVIAAEGTPLDNPAIAVLLSFEDAKEDMAGHLSRVFLGSQIQCAQCHDHPFEAWKQTDFYGMAAFFARTRRAQLPVAAYEKMRAGDLKTAAQLNRYLPNAAPEKPLQAQIDRLTARWEHDRQDPLAYRGADSVAEAAETMQMAGMMMDAAKPPTEMPILFEAPDGEISIPAKEAPKPGAPAVKPVPVKPRFLTGEVPVLPASVARRDVLAAWMTSPRNPYFARAMVNRVWARLMGRGLTEPVENIAKPADDTYRELEDRLAGHLAASGYDLRDLVRLIVSTDAYRRAAAGGTGTAPFAHAAVRPLEPEQIFASVLEATGIEHTFKDGQGPQFAQMKKNFARQFVFSFGNDEPGETVSFQGTIAQALFTLNSFAFNRPVRAEPGGLIDGLKRRGDTEERLRLLVETVLSRAPTAAEIQRLSNYLKSRSHDPTWGTRPPASAAPPPPPHRFVPAAQRMEAMWRAYEDVLWSLIASTEFLVNH